MSTCNSESADESECIDSSESAKGAALLSVDFVCSCCVVAVDVFEVCKGEEESGTEEEEDDDETVLFD